MAGRRVVVVGSLNVDLVVRCARLPRPGETVAGLEYDQQPGGKGLNQAVAARRAGAGVAIVGRIGEDPFGGQLRLLLAGLGIGQQDLAADPAGTGVALIEVETSGENRIVVVPRANGTLGPEQVAAAGAAIRAGDVLLLQGEVPLPASVRAAEIARAAGRTVVFNPAPAPPPGPHLDRLLGLSSWLLPNESELAALTGRADPGAAATDLRGRTGGPVLATLGERGALLVAEAGSAPLVFPSHAVAVVDTVGAGDAFAGAFAASLAAGAAAGEAVAFAVAAGALACTRPGAATAMPTGAEVAALLRAR